MDTQLNALILTVAAGAASALVDASPAIIGAIVVSPPLLGVCLVGTFVMASIALYKLF